MYFVIALGWIGKTACMPVFQKMKPYILMTGDCDVPIRDKIDLELLIKIPEASLGVFLPIIISPARNKFARTATKGEQRLLPFGNPKRNVPENQVK